MKSKQPKFIKYKRGQLILVNFSPSIGSEMYGKHFAIVLTKHDSANNGVLTVVPLSSKYKHYYLDLGNLVNKYFLPRIDEEQAKLAELMNEIMANFELDNNYVDKEKNIVRKTINNLLDIEILLEIYNNKSKNSYALTQNITTISKYRIMKPLSKYDPIKKLIVEDDILDKIDNALIQNFISKRIEVDSNEKNGIINNEQGLWRHEIQNTKALAPRDWRLLLSMKSPFILNSKKI